MMAEVGRMVRLIILLAISLEAVGFLVLYQGMGDVIPAGDSRWFVALFHAISAFCNAGFSLFSDSLMSMADRPLVMGTVTALLIIGGLGFGVLVQLGAWVKGRFARKGSRPVWLDLHTKVVLTVTTGLLLGGWILLAVLEWNGSLAGESWTMKLSQTFFQGATCRTAGFNSMDLFIELIQFIHIVQIISLGQFCSPPGICPCKRF